MKYLIPLPLIAFVVFFSTIFSSIFSTTALRAAETYDIVIYGGTSAAVTAAVQAKTMGKSVIIVSPDKHLGGLSSGGLGFTDSGNTGAIGGLAREFYHRVYKQYENPEVWSWERREDFANQGQGTRSMVHDEQTMWTFEPRIALAVFNEWVEEMKIPVVREALLDRENGIKKEGTRIISITTLCGKTFAGKQFIDATYEGDLMAAAGVSYHVGREDNSVYGETWNGNQVGILHHKHWFKPGAVDPYKIPGDPSSGLLPQISDCEPGIRGTGDHRVQAYCFRVCMSRHPDNRIPFPKPEGYDPEQYELMIRVFDDGWRETFEKFDPIPNWKTDTNNHGPFSFNYIGFNYDYPDASYERRKEIIEAYKWHQQGLLYFLCTDPRVPKEIQDRINQWGLPKDEFLDNGGWPHQIYVREARRMIGEYVMTEHDCLSRRTAPRPIGMGSYTLDSHNVRRYVTAEGYVQNEGDIGVGVPRPYSVDFGSLIPKRDECTNLSVAICVSASHIAFGSIRMEPVFMIFGQSAATAAVFAIDDDIAIQEVNYEKLRERLLADGQRLVYDRRSAPVQGVAIGTLSGIVMDDIDAEIKGHWTESTARQPFVGAYYLHDGNEGKGEKSVTFSIPVPEPGKYEVRLAYTADPNRARNVLVCIQIQGFSLPNNDSLLPGAELIGNTADVAVLVDQTKTPPIDRMFVSLGTYSFDEEAVITISNAGTTGFVIVDAVQLVKKSP
ncbi:MAG: FAD-dependent oxidoreductase [Planctomycetaceae bacterium]|nr:FAD-dependent oxidoreductase [Planctomycetaceae bacterium]